MQSRSPAARTPLHQIRIIENLHILLWLIKDLCWSLEWKPGGITMIVPTVSVAMYITWRSWGNFSEFVHSLAVTCWICANSVWMCGEFFEKELRPVAAGFFALGLLILAFYYLFRFKKDRAASVIRDSPISNQ